MVCATRVTYILGGYDAFRRRSGVGYCDANMLCVRRWSMDFSGVGMRLARISGVHHRCITEGI